MPASEVIFSAPPVIDAETDVLVIGAGACGLVSALRAKAAGAEVVIIERDSSPSGSTSMSSGFVPAPATRFQRAIGINDDTPELFQTDILAKSKGKSHPRLARLASRTIGLALEWLADNHGLEWIVLDDFLYPGHSRHRMHAVPEKTGAALEARLLGAVERAEIPIVTDALATRLFVSGGRIEAVAIERPGGTEEIVACNALILACNGYGGNRKLVRQFIPEIADGLYHGHPGNTGDALQWGKKLGAKLLHLSGYQGHGSLAYPHAILISWAIMMEGAIQVNSEGRRFSDEHGGYSEQAVNVLSQPGRIAWNIFDERIHKFALSFPDYRDALEAGAIRRAESVDELATIINAPVLAIASTLEAAAAMQRGEKSDEFGRDFTGSPALNPPYFAVKVTGALFHTQGGLDIDNGARVITENGETFRNLYAGGGASCGVSGPNVFGYLSGNGLLTAIAFGFIAGDTAARCAESQTGSQQEA
jgi:fumarate reductase flavoprotein subunit